MPSHLTRHVFRLLLANKPIVHRGCLRKRSYAAIAQEALPNLSQTTNRAAQYGSHQQIRTVFNFNMFRKQRDVREADLDPGIEQMMDLARRHRMRARLPDPKEIAEAFKDLFKAKIERQRPIQDTEAQLALQSLKYCLSKQNKEGGNTEDASSLLSNRELASAAEVLRKCSRPPTSSHVELAQALSEAVPVSEDSDDYGRRLYCYISLLSSSNGSERALELVLEWEKSWLSENSSPFAERETDSSTRDSSSKSKRILPRTLSQAWMSVLRGFAKEQNQSAVQRTFDMIQARSHEKPFQLWATREMFRYFATLKDVPGMKQWWTAYHQENLSVRPPKGPEGDKIMGVDIKAGLAWCVANQELQLGHEIVRDVMKKSPSKPVWDAVFVWAASTGKGPDEIGRMIDVMENANKLSDASMDPITADATTINALVQHAISQEDPYSAERFITIGRERNIEPDATTYILQMEYRLKVRDVDGALIAYKNLQNLDTSSNDDLPAVNRLIVALCNTNKHDFETIMNVAADLSDRRARFEPTTVSSLALLHLNRGERDDVIDLLNTHSFHYSSAERADIRDALFAYTVDPKTSTGRAWDAYTIIRKIFDETAREQRTEMMTGFFDRERADMATNIFLNMRQHSRDANLPNVDTYVAAFVGVARLCDKESLDAVYNQLKLDFNIDSTTKLLNSVMIAHIACGYPRYALSIWERIVDSREGPSYSSLHIALRACEHAPFGDEVAKKLWTLLEQRGVEYDDALWTSYITALAGNGDNELAISTLEAAFERGDLKVDAKTLAALFTAAPGSAKQDEISAWAGEKFPGLWAEVESMGLEHVDEYYSAQRVRGFDRSLTP